MANISSEPLVSIVINNYNYAEFLAEAIDSALKQSYPKTEVVVVDDGSTDQSQEVITKYGTSIIPILKPNGGQGSALNAGFSVAKGEIIMFLDSDDVLLPGTVQVLVTAFQNNPNIAKVQYRLQVIDAAGATQNGIVPPRHWAMPSGDLRKQLKRNPNYIWPPTSGNAFSAALLQEIFPIPEMPFRISADKYLNDLSIVLGPLVSLDEVGALYRVHGRNNVSGLSRTVDVTKLRNDMVRLISIHAKRKEIFQKLYQEELGCSELNDVKVLVGKTISLKLEPTTHPAQDNLMSLCVRGFFCSIFTQRTRWHIGVLLGFWFIAMLFSPRSIAKRLTDNLLYPENRGWLINKFRTIVQMIG